MQNNGNKKINLVDLNLKVPEAYYPEWYKKGVIPFEIEEDRLQSEAEDMMKHGERRQQYAPIVDNKERRRQQLTEEDEKFLKIKDAPEMEDESATAWFDDSPKNVSGDKIVDNNDVVDVGILQRHALNFQEEKESKKMSKIEEIKRNLLKSREDANAEVARIAAPGEFSIMFKGKVIHIGKLETIKEVCEQVIMEHDDIDDDDLLIFLRVPLDKIFK